MARTRSHDPYQTLRIGLPVVLIAGLGATAMYLSSPASHFQPTDSALLTTGEDAQVVGGDTPTQVTVAGTATVPLASDSDSGNDANIPAAASDGANVSEVAAGTNVGDCDKVNGFVVTIIEGQPTCAKIMLAADPYTRAVLDNQLGRALIWSGNGWDCIRNFDETGVVKNSHGLVCVGEGKFLLVYE